MTSPITAVSPPTTFMGPAGLSEGATNAVQEVRFSQRRWEGSFREHYMVNSILDKCWYYIYYQSITGRRMSHPEALAQVMEAFGRLGLAIVAFLRQMDRSYDAQHELPVRQLREWMRVRWPVVEAKFERVYGFTVYGDFPDNTTLTLDHLDGMERQEVVVKSGCRRRPKTSHRASPIAKPPVAGERQKKDIRKWSKAAVRNRAATAEPSDSTSSDSALCQRRQGQAILGQRQQINGSSGEAPSRK